jgi:hypothetical protein
MRCGKMKQVPFAALHRGIIMMMMRKQVPCTDPTSCCCDLRLLAHTPKRTSSGSKRQQRIGSFRVVSQKSFLRLEKVEQFSASKVKFIRGYALFWVSSSAKIIPGIPLRLDLHECFNFTFGWNLNDLLDRMARSEFCAAARRPLMAGGRRGV